MLHSVGKLPARTRQWRIDPPPGFTIAGKTHHRRSAAGALGPIHSGGRAAVRRVALSPQDTRQSARSILDRVLYCGVRLHPSDRSLLLALAPDVFWSAPLDRVIGVCFPAWTGAAGDTDCDRPAVNCVSIARHSSAPVAIRRSHATQRRGDNCCVVAPKACPTRLYAA